MKNKDVKKILKDRAEKTELPKFSPKLLENVNHRIPHKKDRRIFVNAKKRWFYPAVAFAVCLVLILSVSLIPILKNGDLIFDGDKSGEPKGKSKTALTCEVLALGNLVSSFRDIGVSPMFSVSLMSDDEENGEDGKDFTKIAKEINGYLLSTYVFMEKENIKTEFKENEDEKYSSYNYVMTVEFTDGAGYKTHYIAYYNEEKDKNKTEIDGKIIIDGEEYSLNGKREEEKDEVESELEVEMKDGVSVSISNETEINENEFEYEFRKGKEIIKSVSVEISDEDGHRKSEIEVLLGGVETVFEFEFLGDRIECCYERNGIEEELLIFTQGEIFRYVFENGFEIVLKK